MVNSESLLLGLSLGSGDGNIGSRVNEATTLLAVLLGGGDSGADTDGGGIDLGAARSLAVSVVDASAGDELGAVAGSDVLGSSVVGSEGRGGGGD